MLYVALMKVRKGREQEVIERCRQRQDPSGTPFMPGHWLQTADPFMIVVADGIAPLMQVNAGRDGLFELTIVPAVSAEEKARAWDEMVMV